MAYAASAALVAAFIWILSRAKALDAAARAPALMLVIGAGVSLAYRGVGGAYLPSDWIAAGADVLLAALAFVAAAQFRISKLSTVCPASFRLTVSGAPLFLVICGLAAYILLPQLTFGAAMLVSGALMLNGAAFDRRAVADTPAPAVIKAAVRLESAAILALGITVVTLLEATASAAPDSMPVVAPLLEASIALFKAFAIGGSLGLLAAYYGGKLKQKEARTFLAIGSAVAAFAVAWLLGGQPVIAAMAVGLLWGEQTSAPATTRVRMRRNAERVVAPIAYLAFGALLAPRIFQADLLTVVFAVAAITIMRAGPRLAALNKTTLPKESQMFLAWFGGAPGAASALFLISLLDAPAIIAQDAVLTVGALAVTFGVIAARLTSRPLIKSFLKQTALAKKRALFAG